MWSVKARLFRRKKKQVQTRKQSKTSEKLSRVLVDCFMLHVCDDEIIKCLQAGEDFNGVSKII